MNKTFRTVVLLLAVWLVAGIVLSWAAILDDALIHLRYADNLLRTHHITYDGIHPNYGTSSLLYVSLLALLRSVIPSPNLPRGVSSVVHLLFFSGIVILLARAIPRQSQRVRLLGLLLLLLLVVPSAIRWLNDGMETGLVLSFTSLVCWLTFRESRRAETSTQSYLALVVLGFFTVMLRTELALLCAIAFAILTLKRGEAAGSQPKTPRTWFNAALSSSHLLVGNLIAMALIIFKMHVLLPDTAVAKSHGSVSLIGTLGPVAHSIIAGLSFGSGMLALWLLTLFLLRVRGFSLPLICANAVFPITVILACLRGQEIQGIRYLVWTLFFSILWNILELGAVPDSQPIEQDAPARVLTYALLTLILLAQPLEFSLVYPILHDRAKLMAMIPGRHLDVLQGKLGIAADVGIIGYFTKANICDINGLIDGRDFARLTPQQRTIACALQKPDFLYLDRSELGTFSGYLPVSDWQICGEYEMTGVRHKDVHYLIVPPSTAEQICRETLFSRPYTVSQLFTQPEADADPRPFF
jgi:hypothetical protein